jgi:predicted nucleotidyltransferase
VVDSSVVKSVRRYLRALEEAGLSTSFGVVYGSQARGTADESSDIDLLVVSARFDEPFSHLLVSQLWRIAARVDSRIEPVPCGIRQWSEDDSRAIVEIARREGERVELSEVA